MKFTAKTRSDVKHAIEQYCEGISHLEFSVDDFDNIINDIEIIINKANALEQSSSNCNIPHVMPTAFGIFQDGTNEVFGYFKKEEDAEKILEEQCDDTWYVDELAFTEM